MVKEIKRKFIGDAVSYQKARPNYPDELFFALLQFWEQTSNGINNPIAVDVGCGTGIATKGIYLASQKKCKVIGIEPDLNMLEQAKRETAEKNIVYMVGSAEKLPLEKNSVDIVLAALAMQYFNRPLFYSEAKRVLRKNGAIAIIENNRNWKENPFLEKYESFLEKNSYDKNVNYYSRNYRAYPFLDELNTSFQNATEQAFPWSKKMFPKDFWEMIKSSTSGQQAIVNLGTKNAERQIHELTHSYVDEDGLLDISYISKVYQAKIIG